MRIVESDSRRDYIASQTDPLLYGTSARRDEHWSAAARELKSKDLETLLRSAAALQASTNGNGHQVA